MEKLDKRSLELILAWSGEAGVNIYDLRQRISEAIDDAKERDEFDDKVFFINHCEESKTSFFSKELPGSKVEEDYIVYYNGKIYEINRCHPVGIDVQRDIWLYRLEPTEVTD